MKLTQRSLWTAPMIGLLITVFSVVSMVALMSKAFTLFRTICMEGSHTVRDLMWYNKPDVFLLHEHWLTPASLSKFENKFPQYLCFGSSAMSSCIDSGILRGRPFGGVMTLVNRSLQ